MKTSKKLALMLVMILVCSLVYTPDVVNANVAGHTVGNETVSNNYVLLIKQKISVKDYFADAINKAETDGQTVKLTIENGTGRAKLSKTGVLLGKAAGTVTVKLVDANLGTAIAGIEPLNIIISKPSYSSKLSLNFLDDTKNLNDILTYEGGEPSSKVEITSSNSSVVEVKDQTIITKSYGKAKLKVTYKTSNGDGGYYVLNKTINLVVKEPKLSVKAQLNVKENKTKKIKLKNIAKNASVSWNSSNETAVKVIKESGQSATIKVLDASKQATITAFFEGRQFQTVINPSSEGEAPSETMEVHFIDVGQGDSTLIKIGDHAMLIDAGPDSKGTAVQLYLTKQGVKKLDYMLVTHYDSDHAGGADVIIQKFDCDKVILPNYVQENKAYSHIQIAMKDRGYTATEPKAGDTYKLGTAKITILNPDGTYGDNSNNNSVCLKIENGKDSFIFTGDADSTVESKIMSKGYDVKSTVYKVAHHGSKYSSSDAFVKAVNPKYAVISCGEKNSYYHPHSAVLNILRSMKVSVFRTDEQGTIVVTSTGSDITWNMSPSESWKPGEGGESGDEPEDDITDVTYILNTNTMKFHKTDCASVSQMSEKNKKKTDWSRQECIDNGYQPCGNCKP